MKQLFLCLFILTTTSLLSQYTTLDALGTGTYNGKQGGLYPGGSNTMPSNHLTNYINANTRIDNTTGTIVHLILGASNTGQEGYAFQTNFNARTDRNQSLKIVNAARGSESLSDMLSDDYLSSYVKNILSTNGVTASQVKTIWLKTSNLSTNPGAFQTWVDKNVSEYTSLLNKIRIQFPNCEIIFFSGRHTTKYSLANSSKFTSHKEPIPYWDSWAIKQVIENQINGSIPAKPVLAWKHIFLTDGDRANTFGHRWDFTSGAKPNNVHVDIRYRPAVGQYMINSYVSDPQTAKWFLKNVGTSLVGRDDGGVESVPNAAFEFDENGTLIGYPVTQTRYIGTNGTNMTDVLTSEVKDYLLQMTPAGGIYVWRYRPDKIRENGYPLDLDSVISLNKVFKDAGKTLLVIYTLNLFTTPEVNFSAIDYLITRGVTIKSIEVGNESYSQGVFAFDFAAYKAVFVPMKNLIGQKYPSIPFSIFLAPRPYDSDISGGRSDHKRWNDAAINYLNTEADPEDEVSWHVYFNQNEIPVMADTTLPQKITYNPANFYDKNETFFTSVYNSARNSGLWDATLKYLDERLPGRKVNMTEFGIDNSAKYKNSFAYSALVFWILNEYHDDVETLLYHNGPSPTTVGFVNPTTGRDINTDGGSYSPRLDYYAMSLFNSIPEKATFAGDVSRPGKNYQWFTNPSPVTSTITLPENTSNVQFSGIQAEHFYSGSGNADWILKGSTPSYDIKGAINYFTGNTVTIPKFSFGYITFDYTEPAPVFGCTDPSALNYNPAANQDDGSCYFESDCDCKDPKATNYNSTAPCEDNTLCVYPPPPVCKKKVLWFCVKSKDKCNC